LRDDDLKIDRALVTVGKMVSPPALYSHFDLFYLPWIMLCALIERTEKDITQARGDRCTESALGLHAFTHNSHMWYAHCPASSNHHCNNAVCQVGGKMMREEDGQVEDEEVSQTPTKY
jgi:hypothetical protein